MDGLNRFVKAVEDKVLATVILLGISPWLLLIAIGVKLSSRGPVFYRQERMSWNGTCFYMYKFRSMPVDAETVTGAVWAKPDDDRTTRFGRFLRRTSLDELPQLWNVLTGDMSLVGPRPHALGSQAGNKYFWEVDAKYWQRHCLKPGLTGLAQVRGHRGATEEEKDLTDRLQSDLEYISGWSLRRDIEIVLQTVLVLKHDNAF